MFVSAYMHGGHMLFVHIYKCFFIIRGTNGVDEYG